MKKGGLMNPSAHSRENVWRLRSRAFVVAMFVSVAVTSVAPTASGQAILRYQHFVNLDGVGSPEVHLRRGGDFNGDGFRDYLVAKPEDSSLVSGGGMLEVRSGLDGSYLHLLTAPGAYLAANMLFATSACQAGDVDQDGCDDILVCDSGFVGSGQNLFLFSGATGSVLLTTFIGGNSVGTPYVLDTVADVDGDGIRDVAVVHQGTTSTGLLGIVLQLFSGVDHLQIYQVDLWTIGVNGFGANIVRNAGDVNGDGVDDLILGAYAYPGIPLLYYPPAPSSTGAIKVLSSADGSEIMTLLGPPPFGVSFGGPTIPSYFGFSVDGVGDLNGDGHDDFIVGAPRTSAGNVFVYSGIDGSQMGVLSGGAATHSFGDGVTRLGDVNGDGALDFAVQDDLFNTQGRVNVYSGAGLNLLHTFVGAANDWLGDHVMGLGDLNGDGFPEVGFGASWGLGSTAQRVQIYSFGGFRRYGGGLGGLQFLHQEWLPGATGDPALGTSLCSGGVPGGAGFFALSLAASNLSVMGVPVVIDPGQLTTLQPFVFDAAGQFQGPASLRHPGLGGLSIRGQFFALAPDLGSSNGLEFFLLD